MKDVLELCGDSYSPNYGYEVIGSLLSFMLSAGVPEGRYVLVHPPGSSALMCFKALPPDLQTPGVRSRRHYHHCGHIICWSGCHGDPVPR